MGTYDTNGDGLTPDQRDAATHIATFIQGVADRQEAPQAKKRPVIVNLDRDKRNHVLLIDGARGSGKTSVLLHLIDSWNNAWERNDGAVVPVGLVDLHPIPPSTHLLLYIIQVLKAAIPDREPSSAAHRAEDPWHDPAPCKSRMSWEALLRAVVTGWDDGFLSARRPGLDAETYVLELSEAEGERLHLMRCFTSFVDDLCEDFKRARRYPTGEKRPLFVIGVDDADMNPSRVRELLQVLQLLVHPRVAFVLTGDRRLFTTVTRLHLDGTMHHPLQYLPGMQRDHRYVDERLERLAVDLCDKVIPRSQTYTIGAVSPDEAWRHLARSFLLRFDDVAKLFGSDRNSLRQVFPDTMRKIVDLRGSLARCRSHFDVLLALRSFADDDAEGSNELLTTIAMLEYVKENGSVSLYLQEHLKLEIERSVAKQLEDGKLRTWNLDAVRVVRAKPGSFKDRWTHWLALAANVVLLLEGGSTGGSWDGIGSDMQAFTAPLCAGIRRESGLDLEFAWPIPPNTNLLELEVLSQPVGSEETRDATADDVFLRYLSRVVAAFSEGRPGITGLDLPAYARRIHAMSRSWSPANSRVGRGRVWALEYAGLLAAPESGLPPERANAFLSALEAAFGEGGLRRSLSGTRSARLRDALEQAKLKTDEESVRALRRRIDDGDPRYDWASKVEDPSSTAPAPRK